MSESVIATHRSKKGSEEPSYHCFEHVLAWRQGGPAVALHNTLHTFFMQALNSASQ